MFTFPVAHFGGGVDFTIDQAIRFNDLDSAFLARTPDASNRKTWTFSCWVKRANLFNGSVPQIILSAGDGGNNDFVMQFGQSDDTLRISDYIGGTVSNLITTQLFRDVGAWYHFVLAYDTTQGTAANRIKLYVNGSQVTAFGTEVYPSEDADLVINSAIAHNIGRGAYSSNGYLSALLGEIHFVDATAKAPTDFGKTNDEGVWVPIKYAGAYGTEGYFIDGRDSSDLGDDESGAGNDFSSSGLSSADSLIDSPTTVYPTINSVFDYYTAGNTSYFRPDFAVSKALDGNLKLAYASPNTSVNYCTMSFGSSGKFYFEVTAAVASSLVIGIGGSKNIELGIGASSSTAMANVIGYYANGTLFDQNATAATYGNASSIGNGEFVGVAYSVDDDAIWFCDNGTWVDGNGTESSATVLAQIEAGNTTSAASTDFTDDQNAWFPFVAAVGDYPTAVFNFGQSSFTGSAPSGFTHLNTATTASPSISDPSLYFQSTLYEGDGSTQSINQAGNSTFQPDFAWIKNRDAADAHALFDAVRGATKVLSSNATTAEDTNADTLTAFESDGFALGDDVIVNTNNESYVAWQWKETATAGFDIVTDTGTGSAHTISHSLGVTPEFIFRKDRTATADPGWVVWHKDLGGANYYLNLHDTGAKDTSVNYWNNTLPTSSVFSVGSSNGTNQNTKTFVTYLFASVPGYSSIGVYTGNGNASGPMVYTGFKTAFILIKSVGVEEWSMTDSTRDPTNRTTTRNLIANASTAEADPATRAIDYLSNGFKIRNTNSAHNSSGVVYTYMAFSENPFGGADIAPATAR